MHNDAQSEPVGAQSEPQSESVGVGIFFGCKTRTSVPVDLIRHMQICSYANQ